MSVIYRLVMLVAFISGAIRAADPATADLIRSAVRTWKDLQARMEEPEAFFNRMNQLCMKMTHARRKKDAKRARKAVLRK